MPTPPPPPTHHDPQALGSASGRTAFLREASAACETMEGAGSGDRRKQGQALLKLAQGCLQQLAGGQEGAQAVGPEAQLALYQAASRAAHAVAPRAAEVVPPPSVSAPAAAASLAGGLERILYHLVARGVELKQVRQRNDAWS